MFFTFSIFFNMLFMLLTYVLLCHTAIITAHKISMGNYIFKKHYVFGDIIRLNDINSAISFLVLIILCVIPVTWVACVIIWVFVANGYVTGRLDVFGKNKIIY